MTVFEALDQISHQTLNHLSKNKLTGEPYIRNPSELRLKNADTLQRLINTTVINTTKHFNQKE